MQEVSVAQVYLGTIAANDHFRGHSDHPPSQRIRSARGYERIACPLTSAGKPLLPRLGGERLGPWDRRESR